MAALARKRDASDMVILSRPLAQCASLALRVDDADTEQLSLRLQQAWHRAWHREGTDPASPMASASQAPPIDLSVVEPLSPTREARERDALRLLDIEGNAFQGGRLMHRLKATVVRIDAGESILLLVAPALAHARIMLALGDELASETGLSASPAPGLRLDQHRRAARIG
jgi:hypothetical protein